MFSVITNIYNKKTKGSTLMEFFTVTIKMKKKIWQLESFDVCTTGDTAHIDTIFKLLPHTRQLVRHKMKLRKANLDSSHLALEVPSKKRYWKQDRRKDVKTRKVV